MCIKHTSIKSYSTVTQKVELSNKLEYNYE